MKVLVSLLFLSYVVGNNEENAFEYNENNRWIEVNTSVFKNTAKYQTKASMKSIRWESESDDLC